MGWGITTREVNFEIPTLPMSFLHWIASAVDQGTLGPHHLKVEKKQISSKKKFGPSISDQTNEEWEQQYFSTYLQSVCQAVPCPDKGARRKSPALYRRGVLLYQSLEEDQTESYWESYWESSPATSQLTGVAEWLVMGNEWTNPLSCNPKGNNI